MCECVTIGCLWRYIGAMGRIADCECNDVVDGLLSQSLEIVYKTELITIGCAEIGDFTFSGSVLQNS